MHKSLWWVVVLGFAVLGAWWYFGAKQPTPSPEDGVDVPAAPLTDRTEPEVAPPAPAEELPEPTIPSPPLQADAADTANTTFHVFGTVVDDATGQPVAGALLWTGFSLLMSEDHADVYVSDNDGFFAFDVTREVIGGMGEDGFAEYDDFLEALPYEYSPPDMLGTGGGRKLICRADGYAWGYSPLEERPGQRYEANIRLFPGGTISGRVTDVETLRGVADVVVVATMADLDSPWRLSSPEGTTDELGRYSVESLNRGTYEVGVRARKQGYVFDGKQMVRLAVESDTAHKNIDFSLTQGATAIGTVRDRAGNPIAGILVVARHMQEEGYDPTSFLSLTRLSIHEFLEGQCDDEGRFSIPGLEYGQPYRLITTSFLGAYGLADESKPAWAQLASARSDVFSVARGMSPHTVDLTLWEGSHIRGVARFEDGALAKTTDYLNLELVFEDEMDASRHSLSYHPFLDFQSSPNDIFEIGPLGPGVYLLSQNYYSISEEEASPPIRIEVDGIHDVDGLEIILKRDEYDTDYETLFITGKVVRGWNNMVEGARVEVYEADNPYSIRTLDTKKTKPDGTFRVRIFRDVKDEDKRYDLFAYTDNGYAEKRGAKVGDDVTLRLTEPASVSGVVVDADGKAAKQASVTLYLEEPQKAWFFGKTEWSTAEAKKVMTDAEGRFAFDNVRPGQRYLEAEHPVSGTGASGRFELAKKVAVKELRITLAPWTRFAGIVTDMSGAPIAGAKISLRPAPEDTLDEDFDYIPLFGNASKAESDAQGHFVIANLEAGNYVLSARHPDYVHYRGAHVTVPSIHEQVIRLEQGAGISGQLLQNGGVQTNSYFRLMGEEGMRLLQTDAEGRFEARNLPSGRYVVDLFGYTDIAESENQETFYIHMADIEQGQLTHIDLSTPEGFSIRGAAPAGNMIGPSVVALRRVGGPGTLDQLQTLDLPGMLELISHYYALTAVDSEGRYSLDNVPSGRYQLEVYVPVISSEDFMAMAEGFETYAEEFQFIPPPTDSREIVVTDGNVTADLNR